jgi:signal transduction histidine kinase
MSNAMSHTPEMQEPLGAARLDELEALVANRTKQLEQAKLRLEEDIRKRETAEAELTRRNNELTELNARLSVAQEQLVQSEKLASIGQLAAGVAHEINNPIGYVFSNFETLGGYISRLLTMLETYQRAEASIGTAAVLQKVRALRVELDIDFLIEDIPVMMAESREGITRVRKIVQDLKDFSRADANQEWQWANLHAGIDSTLNIVANEVKYKADVVKQYGDIPDIECQPSHINQVIMNIVVNAAHAIGGGERGVITVRTGRAGETVWIEISDTGHGIPKEIQSRIFDPFFTTKPIGSGTGLGLSLSYGIIQKHNGQIEVQSEPGHGATFRITLPIRQQEQANGAGQ